MRTRRHPLSHHPLRLTAFFTLLTFLCSSVTYAAPASSTLRTEQLGDGAAKPSANDANGGLEELTD